MKTNIHFLSYLVHFFLEWEMFWTRVVEKIKTYNSGSITYFSNIVLFMGHVEKYLEPDGPRMTIWCMHIACWMPKATNTHSEYVILIVVPLQEWLHERGSVLLYTYITCLVYFIFAFLGFKL
jgi:hypothetical protein